MTRFPDWQTRLVQQVFLPQKPSYAGKLDRVFAFDDDGQDPNRKRFPMVSVGRVGSRRHDLIILRSSVPQYPTRAVLDPRKNMVAVTYRPGDPTTHEAIHPMLSEQLMRWELLD
ncbi:MAG: hypothetical protein AB7P76_04055 [Candidatus Melainabacteria bacterium]